MKRFHYGRQNIDEDDIKAVVEVLRSDIITQGRAVSDFEAKLAAYCGAKYAVACSSGTAALHLAYEAAGLTLGDALITSTNTFVATSNAALLTGASPIFSDIDPQSYNMTAATLLKALTLIPEVLKPKVVVPVHFAGLPADMEAISETAKKSGIPVIIEDACHALGATWRSSKGEKHRVGDCSFSDMTVFSFHPVKSITTGEGGAITTNDKGLYDKLQLFRSHGITKDPAGFVDADLVPAPPPPPPWYYEMRELGQNYRITDFQCALGISQLKKLDGFLEERRRIVSHYDLLFTGFSLFKRRAVVSASNSANHLYVIEIPFKENNINKALWFEEMDEAGIRLQVHYIPVHLQPYYQKSFDTGMGDFPVAESYYEDAVSLPIYPGLGSVDIEFIASTIMESLKNKIR